MTNYQNLDVWKKSMLLVKGIYTELKFYPKEEMYALTSQTKRAAISVPANIAEGIGRNYKKDNITIFAYSQRFSLRIRNTFEDCRNAPNNKRRKVSKNSGPNSGMFAFIKWIYTYYEKSTLK